MLVSIDGHAFLQLHHLSEDVGGQPFQRFLASCRTAYHIAYGGDNLLHTHLAIVCFQLWQLLESQGYAHLVASGSTYQSVYLMEVECRQLVHDDAHKDVFVPPKGVIHIDAWYGNKILPAGMAILEAKP